jgi:hypothetical protein
VAAEEHGLGDDLVNASILGFLHLNAGDGDAAVEVYESLLARDPDDPFTLSALGSARLMAGDEDAAEDAYEAALEAARRLLDQGQGRIPSLLMAALYTDTEHVLDVRPGAEDVVEDVRADLVGLLPRVALLDELDRDAPTGTLDEEPLATNFGAVLFVSGQSDAEPGTMVTSVWLHQRPGQEDAPFDVPTGTINLSMMTFGLVNDDGSFVHQFKHPLGSLGRCPVPGPYRIDVYLGRELAGSTTLEIPESGIGDLVFDDNDVTRVGVCRPVDWTVESGDNEVTFDDPESDDRIELRAFASTDAQRRDPDRDGVVAELLEEQLEEEGIEASAPPLSGFPLLGITADGRLACVAASTIAGSVGDGGIRSIVLTMGPDGVFRELAFTLEDVNDLQATGSTIAQSLVLENVGDIPVGHEFDACGG